MISTEESLTHSNSEGDSASKPHQDLGSLEDETLRSEKNTRKMKRHRPPSPNGFSSKRPRKEDHHQRYSFQFQDGRLMGLRDATGVPVAPDQFQFLDALGHLVQQNFPAGHATITLDKTALMSTALAPPVPLAPGSSSSAPDPCPMTAEIGMQRLLACHPVMATVLALLGPFSAWIKLRRICCCWKDAVDIQLKLHVKHLDICSMLGQWDEEQTEDEKQKAVALMRFMSVKATGVQSLVVGNWITLCPEVLNGFEKLKLLDMEGARLEPKLFTVLKNLSSLESLQTISLPSKPHFDNDFKRTVKEQHLQILIGRLSSVQSLTFNRFSGYRTLLQDLKNPEKLTTLFIKSFSSLLLLQNLPRFKNLQNLVLDCDVHGDHFISDPEAVDAALESALGQLKALRCVDLGESWLSDSSVQNLSDLPHLERLTSMSRSFISPPRGVHWAQFTQLRCLELGDVQENMIGCINQIVSLQCLKVAPGFDTVNFACSLPQLHTLCLGFSSEKYFRCVFQLDFQPSCCNIKNLTIVTRHDRLNGINPGLLQCNPGIKNLRIEWSVTSSQVLFAKVKRIVKASQSLETVVFSDVESMQALSQMAALFVDACPMLKNLKTTPDYVGGLKARKKFRHLNISICAPHKDSWLFE